MAYNNWYEVLWRMLKNLAKRITYSAADPDRSSCESMSFNTRITKRPSYATTNKFDNLFVPNENLAIPSSEGVEMTIESWDRVTFHKIAPLVLRYFILESKIVYINPPTKAVFSDVSISDQVKYEAVSKRIFTNPAPPATSGIFFCNEDHFCLNMGEYLNDVICIKSKYDLRFIRLYRNIIRNETIRIMMSIDILVYEAKHLFGVVRTRIFFDLLDKELFHFGSPQAISYFLPNMAESAVRLDVTSFFEHSSDIVNRIMALLLGFPDSKILQQMPEQTFISLLQSVIVSFLSNNKTKRGKSDKGTKIIRLIMVAPGLFVMADGEEIPEDILVRFRHGDEMGRNRFVDAGLEIMQGSEIQDNRPIHSPYFPPDCRLFIYIPTEKGSYWHKKDMQRDNRIRRHGK